MCVCVWERERERERGRTLGFCCCFSHTCFHLHSLSLQITHFDETSFVKVNINLDHLNEWVILICFTLTLIAELGRPAQRPSGWSYIDSHFPCESRKPIIITGQLCVLRPRSTIRLSHTIRSVATGAQWSRPIKLPIVFEFLLSRTIETDSIS